MIGRCQGYAAEGAQQKLPAKGAHKIGDRQHQKGRQGPTVVNIPGIGHQAVQGNMAKGEIKTGYRDQDAERQCNDGFAMHVIPFWWVPIDERGVVAR